ncbi:MAG: hypothetical protein AAF826_00730 [Pseudomonadota bacterium]
MRLSVLLLIISLALSGCIYGTKNIQDSDAVVRAASYQHDGPPTITLYTSVNNTTGAGAHSGLMINGPERILYDPAGRFRHPDSPEQADVHFGFTDRVMVEYFGHHTLDSHHLRIQTLVVDQETANLAYALARQEGRAVDATCAIRISNILGQIPGLNISGTISPRNLSNQFSALPGVTLREIYKGDRLIP